MRKLIKYMAYVILVAMIHIIIACSPPSKTKQNIIANTLEITHEEISGNISSKLEVTGISDILPEPVPEICQESITKKIAEEVSTGQSQVSSISANYVLIPSGVFQMGNNNGDSDEAPPHPVTVNAFYIGKFEVSQKEYIAIIGKNPSSFKGDSLPVENISWYDAVEYCNRLSAKEGLQPAYHGEGDDISCNFAASGYRLPTEAEWEYAAGGGKTVTYSGSNNADAVAWFNVNSDGKTQKIGTKVANNMRLYDMSGNVAEWCWDWYRSYGDESYIEKTRIVRGGGWGNDEWNIRVTARKHHSPLMRNSSVGFRVARSIGK